ncbi:MAG: pantetheine-phosphate adenylyltransferase [Clostridiales Family XIII bacterium]|jgi:pantetheine-phosphate adenylyltransferase|nr:pantetheine-phosphate adenylyltransferase [Clostridiales Family XIII bacterium]
MNGRMLYAGTFDPITNGHLDLIRRGAAHADELVVGVLRNLAKHPTFSLETRTEMIRAATEGIEGVVIDSFDGLLADYVKEHDIGIVLRGLRATTDFEYEIQMAQMNARLYGAGVETIFLMTDPAHSFISSSIVKEVFALGGDVDGLVPPVVLEIMKNCSLN